MKNNWMKYTGVTLGMCLTLSFSPSFVNADEPGEDNSLNLDINLLNDKEDKATIVDIQADNVPILGDLKAQIPAKSPVSANTSDVGEDNQQKSALATVELTNPNGVIDDLDVSVVEQSSMQDENSAESKSSLASVNLSTPITNEVELDVLLSDAQSGDETSSYDGGLVELNAEDLPVLGEVHAGVLDSHYKNAEESTSLSSGLIQADLDDGLLDETSVDVLTLDRNTDGNMTSTKHSGVSLIVGNDTIANINADILTNETIQSIAAVEQPGSTEGDTELTPSIDDATGLTPDEGGDFAIPNEETVSPPKTEDVTGLKPGSDAGGVSPNVNIEEQTPSTVTDGITLNENAEGISDGTVGITHSGDSSSSLSEEEIDGIVWGATGSNAMSEAIVMDTIGMNQNPPSSNGMGQVLPKTGGFFDSIILSLLALFLLATGLGIRRFAH